MQVCVQDFCEELEYWGLNDLHLEPCCQHTYYRARSVRVRQELSENFYILYTPQVASTQLRYSGETQPGLASVTNIRDRERNTEIIFLIYSYFLEFHTLLLNIPEIILLLWHLAFIFHNK